MGPLIRQINHTLDHWINELSSYSFEQLLLKPEPSTWALGQVYMHLIEETRWYNEQILDCLEKNENKTAEMTPVGIAIAAANDLGDIRIQGNPETSANMRQPASLERLRTDLQNLKAETNELWKMVIAADTFGKTRHPGFGFLDPYEWFQHIERHMRHHLKQKARIDQFLEFR